LLAGCSSEASADRTLVITQQAPQLASFEMPAEGTTEAGAEPASAADVLTFDAPITDPDGNEGLLIGYLLTVALPDARTGDLLEERIGTLVYSFGNHELVVSGGTSYPAPNAEMAADEPQLRAVVGGTGAYLGARGEVVTTRNGDGTYDHTFTLLD
jgi:hypothetical protein